MAQNSKFCLTLAEAGGSVLRLDKPDLPYLIQNPNREAVLYILRHHYKLSENDSRHIWSDICRFPEFIEFIDDTAFGECIDWNVLSTNPAAIKILSRNVDSINWKQLSSNPAALELLQENPHRVYWPNASSNPGLIPLLQSHIDDIDWGSIVHNRNAMMIIRENVEKNNISWGGLSQNENAFSLLKEHPNKIDFTRLPASDESYTFLESMGISLPNFLYSIRSSYSFLDHLAHPSIAPFLHILKKLFHEDIFMWTQICYNPAASNHYEEVWPKLNLHELYRLCTYPHFFPQVMHQYGLNPDRITPHLWSALSQNPAAISFLKDHPEKINQRTVWVNPNLFELNLHEMKQIMQPLAKELVIREHKRRRLLDYY